MAEFDHIHPSLQHLATEVSLLTPDPVNARMHDKRNLEAIKASLTKFGFRQPIVVQKQGMIVRVGNGRLQASKEMGWTHVPALIVDENDADALAYGVTDNRTGELAAWDLAGLGEVMSTLDIDGFDMTGLGWHPQELDYLLDSKPAAAVATANPATAPLPAPKKPAPAPAGTSNTAPTAPAPTPEHAEATLEALEPALTPEPAPVPARPAAILEPPKEYDTGIADDVPMGCCPRCQVVLPLGEFGRQFRDLEEAAEEIDEELDDDE